MNDRILEVLRWYADKRNYDYPWDPAVGDYAEPAVITDDGEKARTMLKELDK